MAFSASGFHRLAHVGGNINQYFYRSSGDTLRTIASATDTTYFAAPVNSTGNINFLSTGDLIYIDASDGRGWFMVDSVASTTSAPNSTAVSLRGLNPIVTVEPGTSTSANLTPYGLHHSTGTSTTTYTLDMPWYPGQMVSIVHTGGSTAAITVVTASTVAGSIDSTGVQAVFGAANQALTLMAESTAKWLTIGRAQPATAIVGPVVS